MHQILNVLKCVCQYHKFHFHQVVKFSISFITTLNNYCSHDHLFGEATVVGYLHTYKCGNKSVCLMCWLTHSSVLGIISTELTMVYLSQCDLVADCTSSLNSFRTTRLSKPQGLPLVSSILTSTPNFT